MGENLGLNIIFRARDLASAPINFIRNNYKQLAKTMMDAPPMVKKALLPLIIQLGALATGIAGVAAGLVLLKTGMAGLNLAFGLATSTAEFGKTLEAVRFVSKATSEEFDQLRGSAIQAGIATQFSPQEAAEGLQTLASRGLSARESMETLIPVLDLAAGSLGQLGVAGAAAAVGGTLQSYRLNVDQAAVVTDKLLSITQLTAFQAGEFEVGLARAAATAGRYGTSLDDTLITLGLLRNANVEASVASTDFREATRRVMSDEQALSKLRRIGVRSFDAETGAARSSLDIMMDVADVTRDMTEQRRHLITGQIFGVRGAEAFSAVLNAQTEIMENGVRRTLTFRENIARLRREQNNSAGVAQRMREQLALTFGGQMTLWTGTLQTLKTVFGETFGQVLVPLLSGVREAVNAVIAVWTSMPDPMRKLLATVFLVASAFTAFIGGGTMIVSVVVIMVALLGKLVLIIAAVAAAITTLTVIVFAPFIAVLGVVVGLALLIRKAWDDNLGGFADMITSWVDQAKLAWKSLITLITKGELTGELAAEFSRAENEGIANFVGSIVMNVERLKVLWEGVSTGFRKSWQSMGPIWAEFSAAIDQLFRQLIAAFGDGGPIGKVGKINSFGESGKSMGQKIAEGLAVVVVLLTKMTDGITFFVKAIRTIMPVIRPVIAQFTILATKVALVAAIITDAVNKISALANMVGGGGAIGHLAGMVFGGQSTAEQQANTTQRRGLAATVARGQRREEFLRYREERSMSTDERQRQGEAGRKFLTPEQISAIQTREERGLSGEVGRLETNVVIDRETLGSIIQSLSIDNGALTGEVIGDTP
jgi:TP901 family phage tail tape measure protein